MTASSAYIHKVRNRVLLCRDTMRALDIKTTWREEKSDEWVISKGIKTTPIAVRTDPQGQDSEGEVNNELEEELVGLIDSDSSSYSEVRNCLTVK